MRRLVVKALLLLTALPLAAEAAEYVQIGIFASAKESQMVRGRLESEGFPVVERLVSISDTRAGVLLLVGPYDRVDRAHYQLNKLKELGWKGVLRRFDEERPVVQPAPKLSTLEPPKPKKRRELEWPPELQEPVPKRRVAKRAAPKPVIQEAVVAPSVVGQPLPGVPMPTPAEKKSAPEEVFPKRERMEQRWSGYVAAEERYFTEDALYPGQEGDTASVVLQPELYLGWKRGKSSLTFTPFVRAGDRDSRRNHVDIRELMWQKVYSAWELRLGISRVFWGVTESQHLVDIINQIDLVENPNGKAKLGQPMINLSRTGGWGTIDLYVLPGFRERTFPGVKGRLRTPLVLDTAHAIYESSEKDRHVDWAVRWSQYFGNIDIGLSHFSGTARMPGYVPGVNALGQPTLRPRYDLLDQTGLSLQAIMDAWTWKLEMVSAERLNRHHVAATGGFEYTYFGIHDTAMDLGLLAEYLYDSRGDMDKYLYDHYGEVLPIPFANDLMMGLRWTFNDVQSTEVLFGVIHDLDGNANNISLEANRRLGDSWKLALEYRSNVGVKAADRYFYPIRMDDYLQIGLFRYF